MITERNKFHLELEESLPQFLKTYIVRTKKQLQHNTCPLINKIGYSISKFCLNCVFARSATTVANIDKIPVE